MKLMGEVEENSSVNVTWTHMMNQDNDVPPRVAVCINHTDYPASLELHKIYRILPDHEAAKDGDVRVVDEGGGPDPLTQCTIPRERLQRSSHLPERPCLSGAARR